MGWVVQTPVGEHLPGPARPNTLYLRGPGFWRERLAEAPAILVFGRRL